jgi:hypothetical protein
LWAAPWRPTSCWLALHAASGIVLSRSTRLLAIMQSSDSFTVRDRRIQLWLGAVLITVVAVVIVWPPLLWLCAGGFAAIMIGWNLMYRRTGQFYVWGTVLSRTEGAIVVTGAILIVVPLIAAVAIVRFG